MSVASVHSVGRHLCGALQDAPWESPVSDRCRHLMEQLIKDQVFFFYPHNISSSHFFCESFQCAFSLAGENEINLCRLQHFHDKQDKRWGVQ